MTDTRTCESCSHLRTEHKLHGIPGLPETVGRGWCSCCDCPQFIAEPDDNNAEIGASDLLGSVG